MEFNRFFDTVIFLVKYFWLELKLFLSTAQVQFWHWRSSTTTVLFLLQFNRTSVSWWPILELDSFEDFSSASDTPKRQNNYYKMFYIIHALNLFTDFPNILKKQSIKKVITAAVLEFLNFALFPFQIRQEMPTRAGSNTNNDY